MATYRVFPAQAFELMLFGLIAGSLSQGRLKMNGRHVGRGQPLPALQNPAYRPTDLMFRAR